MAQPTLDFAILKSMVSLEQVLAAQELLGAFSCRGDRLTGPCPLHRGDNRHAFVISRSRNLWYCFSGCGADGRRSGGDLIDFVRSLLSMSYKETARYLSGLAASPPAMTDEQALRAHRIPPGKGESDGLVHTVAPPAPCPSDQPVFRPFLKRLALEPDVAFLSAKGIRAETAREFEVGAYQGTGWLKGCIGVRLFDVVGKPVGYAGRRLTVTEVQQYGKWKLPRGLPASELLYNYHRIEGQLARGVFVAECPWTVMRLHQLDVPAVALLGLQLSETRRALLSRAFCVTLMMDGDRAGREASQRLSRALAPSVGVRIVNLPPGRDPDDLSGTELARWVHGNARQVVKP